MGMTIEQMEKFNSGELVIPFRKEVISYMHYSGENWSKLSDKQHFDLYYMADGMGIIDPRSELATMIGYDWSHVRDSSPEAIASMYVYIKREVEK